MKILVTVKRIPDPDEHLKFAGGGLDLSSVKWIANTFDEYAVETALRLSENKAGTDKIAEVIVLTICKQDQRQHLTQFLAMGADRGIVVDCDDSLLDTITVSKLIAAVAKKEGADLCILGKLSQDNEGNQVGQRVAALLDQPQACFAAELELDRASNRLTALREVDDGTESKRVPLPAVVTVDLRIVLPKSVRNGVTPADFAYTEGPRLASLRGITMAKRKTVDVLTLAQLGVSASKTEQALRVNEPPRRASGQRVTSVEQLVEKLVGEAKVL